MSSNAERQKRYRERLKEQGLQQVMFALTEEEQFFLERVLRQMRSKKGLVPAAMRDRETGRYVHLDT